MDLDDPALGERLRRHKTNRARLNDEIALASDPTSTGSPTITPLKLERLAAHMRQALKTGSVEFRRAYLRMFVHRVVVRGNGRCSPKRRSTWAQKLASAH
jgi:hypothetical protein